MKLLHLSGQHSGGLMSLIFLEPDIKRVEGAVRFYDQSVRSWTVGEPISGHRGFRYLPSNLSFIVRIQISDRNSKIV
jgi:hypothetical protein